MMHKLALLALAGAMGSLARYGIAYAEAQRNVETSLEAVPRPTSLSSSM